MYLFILESLGTQELILIGLIALVVFGPRKLPEMARKLGSMMTEFRKVSGDFRSTWENAVKLDETEETKTIENVERSDMKEESEKESIETKSIKGTDNSENNSILPTVRQVSKDEYESILSVENKISEPAKSEKTEWI